MTNLHVVDSSVIIPDLMRRAGGGWLAIAPKNSGISIGVTGDTAEDAREKFGNVIRRWLEILATGQPQRPASSASLSAQPPT